MPAKRHHAVPRFYLSRFAAEDGLVWLHDVGKPSSVRVSPKDAIVENYLYAPEVGENPKDDLFETFLAQNVEAPAAPAIGRLAEGAPISSDDREKIAVFLAYQEFRVPRMRDAVTNAFSQIGQRILDISMQNREAMKKDFEDMGTPICDADLDTLIAGVQRGGIKVEATKAAWLGSSLIVSEIAEMLSRMPWAVLEAPTNIEFLTSDAPIVKVLTDRTVPRVFAGGWLSPSAESTFALDPSTILVIRPDGKEGRSKAQVAWCEDVNNRLVANARRFVISRSRDQYIQEISAQLAERRSTRHSSQQ